MAKTKARPAAKKTAATKAIQKKAVVRKPPPKATVKKPQAKKAARPALKPVSVKKTIVKKTVVEKAIRPAVIKKGRPAPVTAPSPIAVSKDGRAPDSPWFTPTLTVRTAEAAIDFYQRAFGFTVDFTMPGPTGAIGYAQLRYQSALLQLAPEGAYGSTAKAPVSNGSECPSQIYVYCGDVDALIAQARAAGAIVLSEPADMFWGDRVASLSDPEGYRWAFATNIGEFDSSKAPPSDYPKPA